MPARTNIKELPSMHRMPNSVTSTDLKRLRAARIKVARLVIADRAYAPIFARLDREIKMLEAEDDLLARASAIAADQSAAA